MKVTVKIVEDNWEEILKSIENDVHKVVVASSAEYLARATALAPVKTGALEAGIYFATRGSNPAMSHKSEAQSRREEAGQDFYVVTTPERMLYSVIVAPVWYSYLNEYGLNGRKANMYMTAAGLQTKPLFEVAIKATLLKYGTVS